MPLVKGSTHAMFVVRIIKGKQTGALVSFGDILSLFIHSEIMRRGASQVSRLTLLTSSSLDIGELG